MLASAPAHAADNTVALDEAIEVRAGKCLEHSAISRSVQTFLGRAAIDARIRVTVEELPDGRPRFVVRREGEPPAERTFKPSDLACADLRAAVALAIAMAIDATILQAIIEPPVEVDLEPEEPPSPAPPPKAKTPPEPKPRKTKPKRKRPTPAPAAEPPTPIELDVNAMALFGVLPVTTVGVALGLAMPITQPLWVRGAVWGTSARSTPVGEGRARVSTLSGELEGCYGGEAGIRRIRGCGGVAAGRWSAEGQQFLVDRSANLPWVSMKAGLELGLRIADGLLFTAKGAVYVPVVRPTLEARDTTGAVAARREPPAVGATAATGFTFGF